MTRPLTYGRLCELCRHELPGLEHIRQAALGLAGLARWWLRPELLGRLASLLGPIPSWEAPTAVPTRRGDCWLACVTRGLPMLRLAVVLPLRWRWQTLDDPALPAELQRLAGTVCRTCKVKGWGLWLGAEGVDLSPFQAEPGWFDSGWASLAGALLLADRQLCPRPDVWASACWEAEGGVGPVNGLPEKIDLAGALGAKHFFVSYDQRREARSWRLQNPSHPVTVEFLAAGESGPVRALAPYLTQLGHPPGAAAPFEERKNYYLLLPSGEAASGYYWDALLSDIALARREQAQRDWPDWAPRHFVTVVSYSEELVPLGVEASGAKRCLLLYTADKADKIASKLARVRRHLEGRGVECQPALFTEGPQVELVRQFHQHLRAFLPAGTRPEEVCLDLTPGKKPMSLALAEVAPPGSSLLYLDHEFRLDRRAETGTEAVRLWRTADSRIPVVWGGSAGGEGKTPLTIPWSGC
jgi:hypothetical protein